VTVVIQWILGVRKSEECIGTRVEHEEAAAIGVEEEQQNEAMERLGDPRKPSGEAMAHELLGRTTVLLPSVVEVLSTGKPVWKKTLSWPGLLARRRWSWTKGADESMSRHECDTERKRATGLAGR
jgi:hypothetical protein